MKYRKILRFPIVALILITHGINPFGRMVNILPLIRLHLADWEKEYIINTCLHPKSEDYMRELFYG